MDYKEYLDSLNEKSCWVFTKQETDFKNAYLSAKLFNEIPDKAHTNIEEYFRRNHSRYGIGTDRHRTLVFPQFFGLLTKSPFYERGGTYNNEKPTQVFDCILKEEIEYTGSKDFTDSFDFNIYKTEQLLKLKIHAIIDTANNNSDYHILPVIFIYKVLKELQMKYSINKVSYGHLFTYIMTCKEYSDYKNAVKFIKEDAPISEFVSIYNSNSRVLACLRKNTNLFIIKDGYISINEQFDDYFYNHFFNKYDMDEIHEMLYRDVDYSYFLCSYQNFCINLIDVPLFKNEPVIDSKLKISYIPENNDIEEQYEKDIDSISENNINELSSEGAHSFKPKITYDSHGRQKIKANPELGKIAIMRAYYSCLYDPEHESFISQKTHKPYMEGHHFVQICKSMDIWEKYNINVDCVENIVSLCPNCHRAIHHGTNDVKKAMIDNLYPKLLPKFRSIGFRITKEEIYDIYKVNNDE